MQVTRKHVNMHADNSKPDLKQTCEYNNSLNHRTIPEP